MRTIGHVTALLLASVLGGGAQTTTAELTGTVVDGTKAVVTGANVSVVSTDTGARRETVTTDAGSYTMPLLPPGSYRLTVEKQGFKPVTFSGVTLQVAQVARLDFTLEVGSVTESVEVTATAPLLEQETSALGQVVDQSKVVNLPLNGRSSSGWCS